MKYKVGDVVRWINSPFSISPQKLNNEIMQVSNIEIDVLGRVIYSFYYYGYLDDIHKFIGTVFETHTSLVVSPGRIWKELNE